MPTRITHSDTAVKPGVLLNGGRVLSCQKLGSVPLYEVKIDKADPPPEEIDVLECDWCGRSYRPYVLDYQEHECSTVLEDDLCRRCAEDALNTVCC